MIYWLIGIGAVCALGYVFRDQINRWLDRTFRG